jgi:acyl-CoA hydrolase
MSDTMSDEMSAEESANELAGKTVDDSATIIARTMQPADANVSGNVHGGAIMRMVDEAGGAVAVRHSRRRTATVAMDSMTFKQPVNIGDFVTIHARLTSVGRTSMEIEAQIQAENLRTGDVRHAGTSYLIYVALDDAGRPTPVPPLILRTEEERARARAAAARRERRERERREHAGEGE